MAFNENSMVRIIKVNILSSLQGDCSESYNEQDLELCVCVCYKHKHDFHYRGVCSILLTTVIASVSYGVDITHLSADAGMHTTLHCYVEHE